MLGTFPELGQVAFFSRSYPISFRIMYSSLVTGGISSSYAFYVGFLGPSVVVG